MSVPFALWTPDVAQALERLLVAPPVAEPLAIFDMDGTCLHHDAGEAVFHALVDACGFAFDDTLFAHIGASYGADTIRAAWHALQSVAPDDRSQHPMFARYRANMLWAYYGRVQQEGVRVAYPWLVQLLAGLAEAALGVAVRDMLRAELQRPLGREAVASAADRIALSVAHGVRPYPAVQSLMHALWDAHWEIWIVSASNRWTVEACIDLFQWPVHGAIGMAVAVERGVLTSRLVEPAPVAEGKVAAIAHHIGRMPALVLGDSANDYAMMQLATHVSVLIDHGHADRRAHACAHGWLVQPAWKT